MSALEYSGFSVTSSRYGDKIGFYFSGTGT